MTITTVPRAAAAASQPFQAGGVPPAAVSFSPPHRSHFQDCVSLRSLCHRRLCWPAAPFGAPMWSSQPPRTGAVPMPSGMQAPPRMFGMPPTNSMGQQVAPVPPVMGHSPLSTSQIGGPSKIDPNQIPRPTPSSSIAQFETRQSNQACIPPPATGDFIVRDTGNCSPRLMRCTMSQIPCTGDLLSTSCMPLALMIQPLALPHPNEEPIQIVDFGEGGPLRCSRCKGYINPFMRFVDHGRRFICNLCGFTDETPRDYYCNLGPDGRRRDADERPELCRGTVEFVATKEYMIREPMPAVFFFLIDVSMNAIQTGATAAACSSISQSIAELPEGPRTMVGIATFDSSIHFYNLKRVLQQPVMLIVPDIQDVYTPLHSDIIVQLAECREHLEQLLDSIPTMFESNKVAESAFGAAIKASFLAMKPTGGRLLVFQSGKCLCIAGFYLFKCNKALVKSIGLRNDGKLDDRSYWITRAASLSVSLAIPFVYPRMISIHDLTSKEDEGSIISATIPLSSEHISEEGIYLLENGEDCLIYVGNMVNPDILQQLFGTSSVEGFSSQLVLQQFDNDLSKKLNEAVNEIRRQRCSYLRLQLCTKSNPSGMLFFSYMIEDKAPGFLSYVEFLVHVHRQIQTKMT
ncbi:uncharacterized protein A4U43_C10F5310 [Asparagus officinalis]|uniref:Protein transport protein Sec24-like CEF n=1 Tax=Asparagus officinalis TaxID=4686 RepID=A0A5P1E449_ASPOF|nr:uncharacterized protein A4U43_C10F5310 [Asparagus officinalis]